MRRYLKESFHWLFGSVFKPITLREEAQRLTRKETAIIVFKVLPVGCAVILFGNYIIGSLAHIVGVPFSLFVALGTGLGAGLVVGLGVGLVLGLVGGLGFGLVLGLGLGLGFGLVVGLGFGLGAGLGTGLATTLFVGRGAGLFGGLVFGLVFGLVAALVSGLVSALVGGASEGFSAMPFTILVYVPVFLLIFLRPFYLVPHLIQYLRAKKSPNPFPMFRNSPVYWDEVIATPLPYLARWLVQLANRDRERGLAEILHLAERRPYQRRAAQRALIMLAVQELQHITTLEGMARAGQKVYFLPSEMEYAPPGLKDARLFIDRVSQQAQDYLTRATPVGQAKVLEELQVELRAFRDAMALVKPPTGPQFSPIAEQWLRLIEHEATAHQTRLAFTPIPNPFIFGNPLQPRDEDLFKGRRDITVAIEENIINAGQRPALLLYGRRRIGKTSTLLNLPRLLSSQFIPVFVDCQDAKWRESDAVFCYQLAAAMFREFDKRDQLNGLRNPRLEQFEKYPFTALDEFLDQIERHAQRIRRQILLTLDEYERLEEGIETAKITKEILNQLRSIIQHRQRIVVLLSGSHRFEELKVVNWADYLINAKTLELSFLSAEDARELITGPLPTLEFEPGVVEKILALTHCQPYLLQAVASELVNHLNSQKQFVARLGDLDVAVEKVLVSAQVYFFNSWQDECSEEARDVLRAIARNDLKGYDLTRHQKVLQDLYQKEILEKAGDRYQITVDLFRRWILKNQIHVDPSEIPSHR